MSAASETFGHEPVLGFSDGRGVIDVCARCKLHGLPDFLDFLRPIEWPCATAVVLGVTEQEAR